MYLHEEALHESFSYVHVVVLGREIGACSLQIKAIHNSWQLLPHIIGLFQRPEIDEILVAPVCVLVTCNAYWRWSEHEL